MEISHKDRDSYFVVRNASAQQLTVEVGGRLVLRMVDQLWPQAKKMLASDKSTILVVDANNVSYCDAAGIAFLSWLKKHQTSHKREFLLLGLSKEYTKRMEKFEPTTVSPQPEPKTHAHMVSDMGYSVYSWWRGLKDRIIFIGNLTAKTTRVLFNPSRFRFGDFFQVVENCGPNAFGLSVLIGMLFGLILAFQATVPMKMFGVEIYVADLVALSLLRVLGSFIAAILFCARSGSSFAAELGTMKLNEEIDALTTLGLDPMSFLVVPRVIASIIMVPLLALSVMLFGLIGAGIVMYSLGFAPITYFNQLVSAVSLVDFSSGLFKSFIYGYIIAAVGCYCGMRSEKDSAAVGKATTAAVVNGIVLIVVAEGIMSVMFYLLGV